MNLAPQDLKRHLQHHQDLIYLITGDEILLIEESIVQIIQKARTHGYEEHIIIEADMPNAGDIFLSHRHNFSLFSSKKILEIRCRQKMPATLGSLIVETCLIPDPNYIILFRMPKLSRTDMQVKWYKTLEQQGCCIVTIWPLKGNHFFRWIQSRFTQFNMQTTLEGYTLIATHTEGNLLAAAQIIEKLMFLGQSHIAAETIQLALSDAAHYDVFALCDAALNQDPAHCLKILTTLKMQNSEPAIILWALMQDVRKLATLFLAAPQTRGALFQKQGIWSARQALFQKALVSFNMTIRHALIQKAYDADAIIKGVHTGNIWSVLEDFCLILSAHHLYSKKTL